MPDENADANVPEWVKEMREMGDTVRVGTEPGELSTDPEDHLGPPYGVGAEPQQGIAADEASFGPATAPAAEEAAHPAEPYWVERMRQAGYTVRVGTDPRPLPYKPEVSFHDWPEGAPEPRMGMHERVLETIATLRRFVGTLKRRTIEHR